MKRDFLLTSFVGSDDIGIIGVSSFSLHGSLYNLPPGIPRESGRELFHSNRGFGIGGTDFLHETHAGLRKDGGGTGQTGGDFLFRHHNGARGILLLIYEVGTGPVDMVIAVGAVAAVAGFEIQVFPTVYIGMDFNGSIVNGGHFALCHGIVVPLAIGEIDVVRGAAVVVGGTAGIGHLIVDAEHGVEIGNGTVEPHNHLAGGMGADATAVGQSLEP